MALLPQYLQNAPGTYGQYVGPTSDQLGITGDQSSGFAIDPVALYLANYGALPDYSRFVTDPNRSGWQVSDELAALNSGNLTNQNNFQVLGINPDGSYDVKVKSGDKEGTIFNYVPQSGGGYALSDPQGTVGWNTNENLFDDPIALAMMLGTGAIAGGAIGAANGLWADPLTQAGGGLATGGSSAAPASSGGFIENLLGQSTASGGSLGAAQTAAPGFLAGAAATAPAPMSLVPFTGATTSALLSGAGLTGAGYQLAQTAAEQAANAATNQPSVGPGPSSGTGIQGGTNQGSGGNSGGLPTDAAGWLKLLGPLVGGGLLAYEASRQNGQQNPTDAWTRDWARNQIANAPAAPTGSVTEQYRNAMMSGLSQGENPALSGLLNKRYY